MASLFIIVKGNRAKAEAECTKRGIACTFESGNHNETYGYAKIKDMPKVIAWFAEDQGWAGPLAEGSCLWYAEREGK